MVEVMKTRVAVVALAFVMAVTAFAGVQGIAPAPADASAGSYASWFASCYLGGEDYYWYKWNGYWYWDWC